MAESTRDRAVKDLPGLRASLGALVKVASSISRINIGRSSHSRFMLASYAAKQREHGRSLLRLEGSMDTVLVARSMLEGLVQLLWAMRQPRRRPLTWRAYVFVVDWRRLQMQRASGLTADPAVDEHTKWGLRRYGKWYLTKEARRAAASGKSLPLDPYAKNWYGERETELFRAIDGDVLLEGAYAPFSEWHHWRPGAIGRLISYDNDTSTFGMTTSDPNYEAMSYGVGFQCLWHTLRLLNRRCRLGIGKRLQELRRCRLSLGKQARTARPTSTT